MLNADLEGGRDRPFRMDVVGTEGMLTLSGHHPYGFQSGEIALETSAPPHPAPSAGRRRPLRGDGQRG